MNRRVFKNQFFGVVLNLAKWLKDLNLAKWFINNYNNSFLISIKAFPNKFCPYLFLSIFIASLS
jgi:hypothetical protein